MLTVLKAYAFQVFFAFAHKCALHFLTQVQLGLARTIYEIKSIIHLLQRREMHNRFSSKRCSDDTRF